MNRYLAAVLTLGALSFTVSIPLATAHAKDAPGIGLANASELPACPSLFRCVVK